jgi:hypothetical protein
MKFWLRPKSCLGFLFFFLFWPGLIMRWLSAVIPQFIHYKQHALWISSVEINVNRGQALHVEFLHFSLVAAIRKWEHCFSSHSRQTAICWLLASWSSGSFLIPKSSVWNFYYPDTIFVVLSSSYKQIPAFHFKVLFFNLHSGGWNQGPLDTAAT